MQIKAFSAIFGVHVQALHLSAPRVTHVALEERRKVFFRDRLAMQAKQLSPLAPPLRCCDLVHVVVVCLATGLWAKCLAKVIASPSCAFDEADGDHGELSSFCNRTWMADSFSRDATTKRSLDVRCTRAGCSYSLGDSTRRRTAFPWLRN